MLFNPPQDELTDAEIAAVLVEAMASAGRLPRSVDLLLAGIAAEHLVEGIRAAGLIVSKAVEWRTHP